jgi:endogenous inhibitor of DNA gyrase (YacG/DUF329 family)
VRCPICKKPVDDAQAKMPRTTYPFCSERCKLIDLGRWLSGTYQISAEREDDGASAPHAPPHTHDSEA